MGNIVLVTGGARSGKSSYALHRCEQWAGDRCFIATSPATDPEMQERIEKHKNERQGRGWKSIEEERDVDQVISRLTDVDVILVDCLTLWVNNLMFEAEKNSLVFNDEEMRYAATDLIGAAKTFKGSLCLVTNEVGMGIVPENSLARKYRDLVGRCNAMVAEIADEVVLVSCGIPLVLK